jgi:hypothetical protein
VAVDAVNAVVLASIPIASWFGALTVPHLLVAAFVVPALFVFFDAADFGALPTLVGRDRIAIANSALWSTSTVVETVVPLAAAALFAVVSPASLIAVDALSYVASAALIRTIVRPLSEARQLASPLSRSALVADVREGLVFLWSHVTLRSMTAVGTAQSISGGAFVGQMVVWADRDLDVREGDCGSASSSPPGVLACWWRACSCHAWSADSGLRASPCWPCRRARCCAC